MWLLYLLAAAALTAYLKIGDLIALKGHRVWRQADSDRDRVWQWLLFPYSRANNRVVGQAGEGLAASEAADHETCPHWYRIVLALLWPLKIGVNAICWAGVLSYRAVIVAVRLLCGLVMLAISPRVTFSRLTSGLRHRRPAAAAEPTVEEPLQLMEDPPPDPLYPHRTRPAWLPEPDSADEPAEAAKGPKAEAAKGPKAEAAKANEANDD